MSLTGPKKPPMLPPRFPDEEDDDADAGLFLLAADCLSCKKLGRCRLHLIRRWQTDFFDDGDVAKLFERRVLEIAAVFLLARIVLETLGDKLVLDFGHFLPTKERRFASSRMHAC